MVLLYGTIFYIPAIAIVLLIAWVLRGFPLSPRIKRAVFVVAGILLLTPLPTPVATLYATLVPSLVVLASNDPIWYAQFWRLGLVAGIATGYICWLFASTSFRASDANEPTGLAFVRSVLVGISCGIAMLLLVILQKPEARGPFLTTADVTYTTSCHNLLRDGRRRISTQVNMDLVIPDDDWEELTNLFEQFAGAHDLAFRDASESRPDVVRTLYLSVCNDAVAIQTSEQRWASRDFRNGMSGRGVGIGVYEVKPGSDWVFLTRRLIERLEARWPSDLRFRDGGGRIVLAPEDLQREGNTVQ